MLSRLKPRRSPGTVVALGGTAIAAGTLTGTQKKQVKKIATKVFKSNIGGASVAHASTANTATHATSADSATKATSAENAKHATTADTATKAADAEKLAGQPSGTYQRKLNAGCLPPTSIAGISQEGDVTCTSPVQAIVMTPAAVEAPVRELGNGLQLVAVCHDGGVFIGFQNIGAAAATLNWFYGDAEAARANGANVSSSSEQQFSFVAPTLKRIEGQFIWSVGSTVTTVNLHAFDGGTFCEVRGTAETANG